ncbi:hypothetical protein ACF09J_13855 [Streptomyces sp. NPDC014889]|uniref:hypothetical protein n=1 Tax=Streptomyces sp. NPDC014889 TaxID=3364928 RepID=UPI0037026930
MRTRTATATLTAIAALTALTACSSSGDDASKPSSPTTASSTPAAEPATTAPAAGTATELERVVSMYTDLYFGGDGKGAYAFLSKRCQAKAGPDMYAATVEQAAKEYGPDHPATDVKPDVSGDLARVSYKVKGLPKFDQDAQPWAREGGAWKYDAC